MADQEKRKLRLATVWLGGCSGCTMSFLDLGEHLIELAQRTELVYGPLTDAKEFPPDVDITVIEGSINNTENRAALHVALRRPRPAQVRPAARTSSSVG